MPQSKEFSTGGHHRQYFSELNSIEQAGWAMLKRQKKRILPIPVTGRLTSDLNIISFEAECTVHIIRFVICYKRAHK